MYVCMCACAALHAAQRGQGLIMAFLLQLVKVAFVVNRLFLLTCLWKVEGNRAHT